MDQTYTLQVQVSGLPLQTYEGLKGRQLNHWANIWIRAMVQGESLVLTSIPETQEVKK